MYARPLRSQAYPYGQGVQRNLGPALPQDLWGPVEEVNL